MRREDSFDVACAHYRSAPELFNDEERLHLYALYKQATAGRAPGHNAAVPRMALLRSAELAAWRQLRDTPQPAARREYVEAVEAVERVGPRAGKASEIRNFKGCLVSADFWTSDHLLERSRSVNVFFLERARLERPR